MVADHSFELYPNCFDMYLSYKYHDPFYAGNLVSNQFQAYQINKSEAGQTCELKQLSDADLMDGDVTVKVEYSTLNYKDGLALTGKSSVVRTFPLTPGEAILII